MEYHVVVIYKRTLKLNLRTSPVIFCLFCVILTHKLWYLKRSLLTVNNPVILIVTFNRGINCGQKYTYIHFWVFAAMGDLRSLVVPDWCEVAASWETGHHVFCETAGETQAHLPRTEWVPPPTLGKSQLFPSAIGLCCRGSLDARWWSLCHFIGRVAPVRVRREVPHELLKGWFNLVFFSLISGWWSRHMCVVLKKRDSKTNQQNKVSTC